MATAKEKKEAILQVEEKEPKEKKFSESTLVEVINIGNSDCGYTVNNGNFNVRRTWQLPNSRQEVEFRELKMAMNEAGVRQLFENFNKELNRHEDGDLLITNEKIREKLGLNPRGKYIYEISGINYLLLEAPLDEFEDVLENCPDVTLEKIVLEAINLALNDMNKITLIESYSGKRIFPMIQEKKENTVGEKTRSNSTEVKDTTVEGNKRKRGA